MFLRQLFDGVARPAFRSIVLSVAMGLAFCGAGMCDASAAVKPLVGGYFGLSAERSGAAQQAQNPDCRVVSYGMSYGMSNEGNKPAAAGGVSQNLARCIDDAVRRYGEGVVIRHYNGSHLVEVTFLRAAIDRPAGLEQTEAHRPLQGRASCVIALRSADDFGLLVSLAARNSYMPGNEGFFINPDMTSGGCVEGTYKKYSIVGPHVWGRVIFSDGRGGVVVVTIRYIGERDSAPGPATGPSREP